MTEYLIYVSLVFIPIACWIAYLLNQDGFDIKTIIPVLVLSYLMITAFPFSIQHLGTSVTILVYGVILAILIMVMCKPETFNLTSHDQNLSPELVTKPSRTVAGGETTVFPAVPVPDKVGEADAQFYTGAYNSINSINKISGEQEQVQDKAAVPLPSEDISVEISDTENNSHLGLNDDGVIGKQSDLSAADSSLVIKEELDVVMEGDDSLHIDNNNEQVLADYCPEEMKSAGSFTETDTQSAGAAFVAEDDFSTGAENVIITGEAETRPEAIVPAEEQQTAAIEEQRSLSTDEDDLQEIGINLDMSEPSAQIIMANDAEDSTDIVDWIELGFEAKSQGELRLAAENFSRALQSSTDDELKYLLGTELVSILQNMGDYEQAEVILDHLIQNISIESAVIMELKQQRQYIGLLADELNRLGISGTPIFEVPRFVRIKVNEKMLA